jgi:hypothetical protein
MFGKLFSSMYDGSLRTRSPWQALVTFQQLIVLANKDGEVDMTAEALSLRTGIPLEIIALGIRSLEQPDPDSRTPTEEGRRIIRLDPERSWGWRIVNYDHYRKIRSADERREYMRLHMRAKRAKNKELADVNSVSTPLASVSNVSPSSKQYAVSRSITTKATTSRRKRRVGGNEEPVNQQRVKESGSWLAPICAVWEQHFGGGSFASVAKHAAGAMHSLRKAGQSPEQIADRLRVYLAKTNASYVNVTRFAQTYGEWEQRTLVDENGFLTQAGYAAATDR